jgi:hypothetical protein
MNKKRFAPPTVAQLSIFDVIKQVETRPAAALGEGSLAWGLKVRDRLSDALRHCPLSRFQVAAKMSELTGRDITKTMLDAWTAESREDHRFPMEYYPAFCAVTGDHALLAELARAVGLTVLESKELLITKLGEIGIWKKQLAKDERHLRALLERVQGETP